MTFLIPHAKKFVNRYVSLFFLLILGSGLSLPGPAITGIIIDKVFISKDATMLNLLQLLGYSLQYYNKDIKIVKLRIVNELGWNFMEYPRLTANFYSGISQVILC
ncbi:MAG: hypothetical protein WBC02_13420 [Candidatus Aminicenantaceae bacterium]